MVVKFWLTLGIVAATLLLSPLTAQNLQIVNPVPSSDTLPPNTIASGDISYTTDPPNANLQGLGLRIHYDSSKLTPQLPTNVLPGVTSLGFFGDGMDFDQDPNTDMYGLIEWGDKTDWPGSPLPVILLTANFVTADDFSESTQVNFSASFTSPGYQFASTSAVINAPGDPGPDPDPDPGPDPDPDPEPPPPPPGAVVLEFAPFQSPFAIGDEVRVDLTVSGLQDGASPSLGAFNLNLCFNPAILEYRGMEFGTFLGDGAAGESLGGVVPFDEHLVVLQVSLLLPAQLIESQPASFRLMTVIFRTRGAGVSPLDLVESETDLGDELGDPLEVVLRDASVEVAPTVPVLTELGLWALTALLMLAGVRMLVSSQANLP